MPLEATFIAIDNSDYMRNGDFAPSRLEAQQDAVNLLAGAKTQQNPENTVGVLSMAGLAVEVRVAMTSDVGKVLAESHGAKICGEINLMAGLQVAQLALKHRQNKNQRQRIIVFVGSPLKEDEATLVKLGKKLKKNSVAVDIINFGEENENTPKLEALLNAVNSDDNSHLVTVPPGPHVLSDLLLSSPIVMGDSDGGGGGGGMPTGAGGGGDPAFAEFGVDPTLDPEFAWALRVSMEEERQRQEEAAKKAAEEAGGEGAAEADAPMGDAAGDADADVDEAALLDAAMAMSTTPADFVTPAANAPAATPAAPAGAAAGADVEMGGDDEEMDEEMQLALAMSMSQGGDAPAAPPAAPAAPTAPAAPAGGGAGVNAMFRDASFVQSVLGSLPGVDPSDPRIQSVLNSMPGGDEKKEGDGDKKDEPKK